MIKTGGIWDPNEKNIYFLATSPSSFKRDEVEKFYDYILCAVNEIKNSDDEQYILDCVAKGKRLFIGMAKIWSSFRKSKYGSQSF